MEIKGIYSRLSIYLLKHVKEIRMSKDLLKRGLIRLRLNNRP